MLQAIRRNHRFPVELALLLALVFFLPLREAPKNILWLAYLVAWLVNRARERDFGPRPDAWDGALGALLLSGYLAAGFAGIQRGDGNEWLAVNDLLRYVLLAFCVRRAGYAGSELVAVTVVAVASCAIATIEGIWNFKVAGTRDALQLVSVGHVNHSAIYLAICTGMSAGLTLAFWRRAAGAGRLALATATLLLMASLFLGGSRAAAACGVLLLVLFGLLAARAAGFGRAAWAGMLGIIMVAMLVGGTSAWQRQLEYASRDYWSSHRDLIWARGLVAWRQYPWFGVGMDNYSQISDKRLESWLAAQGRPYDPEAYSPAPHGHSLFVNTLAERGGVGLAALLALLLAWGRALWSRRPPFAAGGDEVALWCASVSGLVVTASIGLVNTTLHHEHAILALLTFAAWAGNSGSARGGR